MTFRETLPLWISLVSLVIGLVAGYVPAWLANRKLSAAIKQLKEARP